MASEKKTGCLKSIFVTVILLTIVFSMFYILVWRVPDNSEKAKIEFERAEKILESNNRLPVTQNGWYDYEKAFTTAYLSHKSKSKKDAVSILSAGVKEEDREYIEGLKKDNKKVFENVKTGFSKEKVRIPVKYKKGIAARVPNFLAMRHLSYVLGAVGELERMDGNYSEASEYFLSGIHLGANTGHSGSLISAMIGIAMIRIDLDPLENMLSKEPVDKETCRYITRSMTRINNEFFTFKEVLDGELVGVEYTLNMARKEGYGKLLAHMGAGPSVNSPGEKIIDLIPAGLLLERERKVYQNWYLFQREQFAKGYPVLKSGLSKYEFPPLSFLTEILVPNLDRAYKHYIYTKSQMRGVEILAALEWYQREKGEYPDSLEKLVPDYLPELPEDPYSKDGKFIYRKEGEGVYLYSVGEDLKDDGTKRRVSQIGEVGDLVFLTPEMIKGKMQKKRIDVKGKTVVNGTGRSK